MILIKGRKGRLKHPEYQLWKAMHRRCYTKTNKDYKDYGEKGIYICENWFDFWNFVDDMGPRPKNHSIDRIDNSKGYSKENCRWATAKQALSDVGEL